MRARCDSTERRPGLALWTRLARRVWKARPALRSALSFVPGAHSVPRGAPDVDGSLETSFVHGCARAAGHAGNSEMPLKHDLHPRAGAPPSHDDAVEQAEPAGFDPPRMSAVNERSPSTTSYMASSPVTCPFRLGCRQRTSATNEPRRPSPEKPSKRPNGGCGAGRRRCGHPHFVKVTSTGRLLWSLSVARAGEICGE